MEESRRFKKLGETLIEDTGKPPVSASRSPCSSLAREKEIDLIVLNSHKIDKVDEVKDWATISYKVGILSHCPVMMVK